MSGRAEISILEYFFQQGFHLELVFVLVPALAYLGVLAVAAVLLGRRVEPRTLRATFTAALVVILVAVVGITTFEAVASWYRPEGDGVMARTPIYTDRIEIAFVALYAALVALAPMVGWLVGRGRAPSPRLVAVAAAVAVVGFLTATLPFVEFLSACHTGAPLLTDRYVACG